MFQRDEKSLRLEVGGSSANCMHRYLPRTNICVSKQWLFFKPNYEYSSAHTRVHS